MSHVLKCACPCLNKYQDRVFSAERALPATHFCCTWDINKATVMSPSWLEFPGEGSREVAVRGSRCTRQSWWMSLPRPHSSWDSQDFKSWKMFILRRNLVFTNATLHKSFLLPLSISALWFWPPIRLITFLLSMTENPTEIHKEGKPSFDSCFQFLSFCPLILGVWWSRIKQQQGHPEEEAAHLIADSSWEELG